MAGLAHYTGVCVLYFLDIRQVWQELGFHAIPVDIIVRFWYYSGC